MAIDTHPGLFWCKLQITPLTPGVTSKQEVNKALIMFALRTACPSHCRLMHFAASSGLFAIIVIELQERQISGSK